ncbi:MAG: hypothetical protein JSW71_14320 [Gemmatimonadota bacterium]|nr:MAG: hypothetical protein JSW71_14320 [Gemmatimonadota bacterium]
MNDQAVQRTPWWLGVTLWVVAVVLMLTAAVYQRLTGPTYRLRGEFTLAGETYRYRLVRSAYSTADTLVTIPTPSTEVIGNLHYKRYPTDDDFTVLPLEVHGEHLGASLPAQPPAGKLEYYLTLDTPAGSLTIPDNESGSVIIRFKGPTPLYVLLPHVFMMFFAVLIGMRAGLAALFAPAGVDKLSWITLVLVTVGGLFLGPIVQKTAFGEYWTGFPFGFDLTDNKTLIMWLVWVVACAVLLKYKTRLYVRRAAVVGAAVVMVIVYLIPHSLRGSQLDYSQLDEGVPATEAIESGR